MRSNNFGPRGYPPTWMQNQTRGALYDTLSGRRDGVRQPATQPACALLGGPHIRVRESSAWDTSSVTGPLPPTSPKIGGPHSLPLLMLAFCAQTSLAGIYKLSSRCGVAS
ncbi:uncharacterized protein G2W53_017297 [Senna tora]|uniref:Uncharacterized protein n=1 Tax=Senna tora TaxID=362788 RepID=A0A834TPN8_9FABA|nr:uncharacterized protein G2W53_017297 [Senna tora]